MLFGWFYGMLTLVGLFNAEVNLTVIVFTYVQESTFKIILNR